MATLDVNDLKAIKDLIEVTVEEVIDKKGLATRDHLGNLPTKDEFYGKMDQVMEELKAIREEQAVQSQHLSDHEDRIEKIESHLSISSD
ncbi:MAG TPA: hypothetical protein VFZ43_05795 [Anaerolineales bacterium]